MMPQSAAPARLSRALASCENGRSTHTTEHAMTDSTAPAARKWMCVVCGFIYDEAIGLPEEDIAPGTRWEDVPDTWTCPDCGATKDDFEMIEVD